MSTPAQPTPAPKSATGGPRTEAGKANSSKNAITLGLFATSDFIRPGEESIYTKFAESLHDDLAPEGPLEFNLVDEIRGLMWRLRRCRLIEQRFLTPTPTPRRTRCETKKPQNSRSPSTVPAPSPHRLMHKCTAELRRLQTERQFRNEFFAKGTDISHLGICDLRSVRKGVDEQTIALRREELLERAAPGRAIRHPRFVL